MSANSQKKYFEKSYYVPNSFNQKNIDILKKKLIDLDEFFHYKNYSNNQIHKLAILNTSKTIYIKFSIFYFQC